MKRVSMMTPLSTQQRCSFLMSRIHFPHIKQVSDWIKLVAEWQRTNSRQQARMRTDVALHVIVASGKATTVDTTTQMNTCLAYVKFHGVTKESLAYFPEVIDTILKEVISLVASWDDDHRVLLTCAQNLISTLPKSASKGDKLELMTLGCSVDIIAATFELSIPW